nr:hypothetical protein [Tanacetum cinerariifolium]
MKFDDQEDSLTTAMMLFAYAITQRYVTSTNNLLRTSLNTRNQAVLQADIVNIQIKNMEELKQMSVNICTIARIQKVDSDSEDRPSYDYAFICEVKLIIEYLHAVFKVIQKEFPEDVRVPMNVFDLMESDLDETLKQNEILKDRLLEATLTHDVERCVFMCFDKNDNFNDEIEKLKRESIDFQ